MKRILSHGITLAVLVGMFGMYVPLFAYAQVAAVVTDPGNTATNTTTAVNTVKNTVKEFSLDPIAQRIASSLLNSMIDSTTNWVNSGFEGNPLFVSNWGDFTRGIANLTATAVLGEIQDSAVTASTQQLTKLLENADQACKESKSDTPSSVDTTLPTQPTNGNTPVPPRTPPANNNFSCSCADEIRARIAAQQSMETMSPNELIAFLQGKARSTIEDYLDSDFPISMCDKYREATGQSENILLSGGYGRDVIKFLGYAYGGVNNGTVSLYMPDFSSLPQDVSKQVAANWKRFGTDFSVGGWDAWDQVTGLNNTKLGVQLLAANTVNQQIAKQVGNATAELQQSGGFLGVRRCKTTKKISLVSGESCPPGQEEIVTPGAAVGSQLEQVLQSPIRKTEGVDGWGDVLSSALVRLTSRLTDVGVSKLNNAIGRQLDIASGKYSGVGGNILAMTPYGMANGRTADSADEVIDLDAFFYGDPVFKQAKNPNGTPKFEPIIGSDGKQVVKLGKPLVDMTRPVYEYEPLYEVDANGDYVPVRDKQGNIVYDTTRPKVEQETKPLLAVGASGYDYDTSTGEIIRGAEKIFDAEGKPVPMRRGGALARTRLMVYTLVDQQTAIKEMPKYLLDLDRCLPGPDYGWQDRFQTKYNEVTQDYFDDKPLIDSLNEIGKTVYSVVTDYESGIPKTQQRCQSSSSPFKSIYNLSGNPNNHLDCYVNGSSSPYGMIPAQRLAGSDGVTMNIPSADDISAFLAGSRSKYARTYRDARNKLDEQRGLLQVLTQLEAQYQQYLADPTGHADIPGNLVRQIVAIRDDIPYTTMIDRERTTLEQIKNDKTSATQLLNTCITEKAKPEYLDIMVKDAMKVLYCPLQYHGNFNQMTTDQKVEVLMRAKVASGFNGVNDTDMPLIATIAIATAGPLGTLFLGVQQLANADNPQLFYENTFSHPDPNNASNDDTNAQFMCFETNTVTDDNPPHGGNQCWGSGDSGKDGDNSVHGRVERLRIWCKDFYTGSYSDYSDALGIGSTQF